MTLDSRLNRLVRISAALGWGKRAVLDRELASAAGDIRGVMTDGDLPEAARLALEVEEVLVQSYLFVGFPGALRAMDLWRRSLGDARELQATLNEMRETRVDPLGPEGWTERGEATCEAVYGVQYEQLRRNIQALHPDLEAWMIREGYGKVLGRPGLPLHERELCVAAVLAALDAPVQLYSHLRGARRTGADSEMVAAMVEATRSVLGEGASAGHLQRMAETWDRVRNSSCSVRNGTSGRTDVC